MKKILLICTTLIMSFASSAAYCDSQLSNDQDLITQKETSQELASQEEAIKKSIAILEEGYNQSKSFFGENVIENHEANLKNAIEKYIVNCLKDAETSKNLSEIDSLCSEIVADLTTKSNNDQAYAITSVMFTLTVLKTYEEFASKSANENETSNLEAAMGQLDNFTQVFFISKMQHLLN